MGGLVGDVKGDVQLRRQWLGAAGEGGGGWLRWRRRRAAAAAAAGGVRYRT